MWIQNIVFVLISERLSFCKSRKKQKHVYIFRSDLDVVLSNEIPQFIHYTLHVESTFS